MLFNVRAAANQNRPKEEKPKNHLPISEILAFRDTWKTPVCENFSVERIMFISREERRKKAEVPKLKTTDNGFKIRDKSQMDSTEIELRRVQSTLNKLTQQNFNTVAAEILSHDVIYNSEVLHGTINILFRKAVAEPVFSGLYARLCARIANYEKELVAEAAADPTSDLAKLIDAAEEERVKRIVASGGDPAKPSGNKGDYVRYAIMVSCQNFHKQFTEDPAPTEEEAGDSLRRANMSNIKFVGELYNKSLVSTGVINFIISGVLEARPLDNDHVEMAINLLNVIGPKYEEQRVEDVRNSTWDKLKALSESESLSIRIRFLLQNLLDLRNSGWKSKEAPPTTSTSAANEGEDGPSSSGPSHAGGSGAPNHAARRPMPRPMSTSQQDAYGSRPRGHGFQQGTRSVTGSFADLTGKGAYPPPPPPHGGYHPAGPPPPFAEAAASVAGLAPMPELSKDQKKHLDLAQPPASLSESVEGAIVDIARNAYTANEWDDATKLMEEAMPQEKQAHVVHMCAVYAITNKLVRAKDDDERAGFLSVLNRLFSSDELRRGYSWFLAHAISTSMREDYPRVYKRFLESLTNTKELDFLVIVGDVMARSANYLDALALVEVSEEWPEEFLDVWRDFLKTWREAHPKSKPSATEILNTIANVRQRPLMEEICGDFLLALVSSDFVSDNAIHAWYADNKDDPKCSSLAGVINCFFPAAE